MRRRRGGVGAVLLLLGAGAAGAQSVSLQIKPQVGDTIAMRIDQQTEMTGVRRSASGEASLLSMTTMKMFSRVVVESADAGATSLLGVTDSVSLSSTDEHTRAAAPVVAEAMRGRRVHFRVLHDGSVAMKPDSGARGVSPEVAQVVSLMPGAFPQSPIRVGETWVREMPLPTGTQIGARLQGKVRFSFRLDSVTHAGDWAYISMRGQMQPAKGPGAAAGTVVDQEMVNGTFLVDRKRGWLTESWCTIVVISTATASFAPGGGSAHMQTRIVQHMRALDRR